MLIIEKIIEKKIVFSILIFFELLIIINQKNYNRLIYTVFIHRCTIYKHLIYSNYFKSFI